jgi:hypothetical protein
VRVLTFHRFIQSIKGGADVAAKKKVAAKKVAKKTAKKVAKKKK